MVWWRATGGNEQRGVLSGRDSELESGSQMGRGPKGEPAPCQNVLRRIITLEAFGSFSVSKGMLRARPTSRI